MRYNQDDSEAPRLDTVGTVSDDEQKVEEGVKRLKLASDEHYDQREDNRSLTNPQMTLKRNQLMNQYNQAAFDRNINREYSSPFPEGYDSSYLPFDQLRGPQHESYEEPHETQIDQNNNMLIMQYESVLQSVNKEFQKLLEKNKQTEEELSMNEMKLRQAEHIIEDFKQQAMAERMNEDKRFNLAQIERTELDNELGMLRDQINHKNEEIDRLNSKVMELEHQTSTTKILKGKIDELMNKNHIKDQTTREKDETLFNLSREVESLRSDIRNMEHIENTLKTEIEELLEKRRSLEDINQSLKNQICE